MFVQYGTLGNCLILIDCKLKQLNAKILSGPLLQHIFPQVGPNPPPPPPPHTFSLVAQDGVVRLNTDRCVIPKRNYISLIIASTINVLIVECNSNPTTTYIFSNKFSSTVLYGTLSFYVGNNHVIKHDCCSCVQANFDLENSQSQPECKYV